MTDKRKLAVSYGSFSCVIEGFDDPFNLMRDIISFYYQVSQEEPEFAHFHQIVDMQELKALLERDLGEEIELEPIAGGVYARRAVTPARLADAAAAPDADADHDDYEPASDMTAEADEPAPAEAADAHDSVSDDEDGTGFAAYAGPADDAFADHDDGATEDDEHEAAQETAGWDTSEEDADDENEQLAATAFDADAGEDDRDEAPADTWLGDPDDADREGEHAAQPWNDEDDEDAAALWDAGDDARDEQAAAPWDETEEPEEDDLPARAEDDTAEDDTDADLAEDGHRAEWEKEDDEQDGPRHAAAPIRLHADAGPDEDERDDEAAAAPEDAPHPAPIRLHDALHADTQPDEGDTDDEAAPEDAPHPAPIRLHDALRTDAGHAEEDTDDEAEPEHPAHHAPHRAPIRLQDAIRPAADDQADAEEEPAPEPAHDRLTLGAALRLGPREAVEADNDDAEDDEPASAFIDRVAERDETRELLTTPQPRRLPAQPPDDETEISIAQIRSDIAALDETEKPKKSGGLRMGKLLRRKPAPNEPAGSPAPESVGRRDTAPEPKPQEPRAEKPRSLAGSMLRVIRSAEDEAAPPAAAPAEPAEDHRPVRPVAELPVHMAEPEPEPEARPEPEPLAVQAKPDPKPEPEPVPAAEPRRAAAGCGRDADPLKSRLHASFGSQRAPSSARDSVDLDSGELQDPYSPRGFAQRVGASSVTELMAAAAAFRLLVDRKPAVTRTDIMETVQMIMGDKPLTAEAKVKAFGKLVRGGDLTRLDGGEFTLAPEQIESFQDRFEAARKNQATGG